MIYVADNEHLARTQADFPKPSNGLSCTGLYPAHIEQHLGAPFSTLFVEFSRAFPLTSAVIDQYWDPMVLIYHQRAPDSVWFHRALLENKRDGDNLMPRVWARYEKFDRSVSMLPLRWRELYSWFNAFGLSGSIPNRRTMHRLPTTYEGRMSAHGYLNLLDTFYPDQSAPRREAIDQCLEPIAAANPYPNGIPGDVRCWCLTDQAESLWVCTQDTSGTVHHVRGDQFDDAAVLSDPEDRLDEYMAMLLEHGSSEGFDFRR